MPEIIEPRFGFPIQGLYRIPRSLDRMTKNIERHPALERAYRVFLEELGGHLSVIESMVQKDSLSSDEAKDISARSHTIKGGAGFLNLPDVAGVAGDLERLLGSMVDDIDRARELVGKLEELVKNLPKG